MLSLGMVLQDVLFVWLVGWHRVLCVYNLWWWFGCIKNVKNCLQHWIRWGIQLVTSCCLWIISVWTTFCSNFSLHRNISSCFTPSWYSVSTGPEAFLLQTDQQLKIMPNTVKKISPPLEWVSVINKNFVVSLYMSCRHVRSWLIFCTSVDLLNSKGKYLPPCPNDGNCSSYCDIYITKCVIASFEKDMLANIHCSFSHSIHFGIDVFGVINVLVITLHVLIFSI